MNQSLVIFSVVFVLGVATNADAGDSVRFDLPPTAVAETHCNDPSLITVKLRLSAMIADPNMPQVDQWLMTCHPRDLQMAVVDYAPKTATDSDVTSPVQVKEITERSESFGLATNGAYGPISSASLGADKGNKDINTVEFDRQAPMQAVSAAGTIDRGRGVYFKLRWTAKQVLEGEKVFEVTFRVPSNWRGGLLDVAVSADAKQIKYGGLEKKTINVGQARFAVATYREGDDDARIQASQVAEAEYQLRMIAERHSAFKPELNSFPAILRHVAGKLDFDQPQEDRKWLSRLLSGRADPHLDKRIASLPMAVRIATLDYVDARDDFLWLSREVEMPSMDPRDEVLVATPHSETGFDD
ncbi:hypothetical protein Pla22_02240 [Rubripirellula amarantea]|uniref:Uncharacterized protein n=1 Tax=Rubripirellula amarantea TaxID=2527999 RepID=A0A5C5WQ83_9BACT|nr:hypothetical protein [Rubripirellula amarantea]TWT52600.1 hypothetical protein Pla22_02240 [Rubripirellula amarantea]